MLDNFYAILQNNNLVQNICNIFTCLSFIGTLYLLLCQLVKNRKNLSVSVIDYASRQGSVFLMLLFQNNSLLPLTVSSIHIVHGEKHYQCELIPKKIRGKNALLIMSPLFPLNLAPKEGRQCFLEFLFAEDIPLDYDKKVVLQIHSNRGLISKQITLGHKSHYLNNKV